MACAVLSVAAGTSWAATGHGDGRGWLVLLLLALWTDNQSLCYLLVGCDPALLLWWQLLHCWLCGCCCLGTVCKV